MNQNKCPACSADLAPQDAACPICGLEGLNQVFLSEKAYRLWEQQVLKPHKESMRLRVFAGDNHGLILTPCGDLYSIGRKDGEQIYGTSEKESWFPTLIAREVISAAACDGFSVWVTRDGEVHYRGHYEESFPGFSGAREVYANFREFESKTSFLIRDREDRIHCLDMNYGRNPQITEEPELQWMLHTPHRKGSTPIQQEVSADTKKLCIWSNYEYKEYQLELMKNGSLKVGGEVRPWQKRKVTDVSGYYGCFLVVYENEDVCWCTDGDSLKRGSLIRLQFPKRLEKDQSYECWKQQLVQDQTVTTPAKVFACGGTGLILTSAGDLYGIGRNEYGEIQENGWKAYGEPHLIARDVISAAAGWYYSIWVSRDGQVHLRGDGSLKEKFPGFSGAKEVYSDGPAFFIVDGENRVYGFGWNDQEQIQTYRYKLFSDAPINEYIYEPVRCPDKDWVTGTPHRKDSMPVRGDSLPLRTKNAADIRKGCFTKGAYTYTLILDKNGRVTWESKDSTEDWGGGVEDIGICSGVSIIVYRNGEIKWHDAPFHLQYNGKRFRLPRIAE